MKKINPWWLTVTVPLALVLFYFWRKQRQSSFYVDGISGESQTNYTGPKKLYTEKDFKDAIPALRAKHGQEMAEIVERIYRWETAHFTSTQYKFCGAPGMEKHGPAPNYGWYLPFFIANPNYLPIGLHTMLENGTGITKTFVVMPSVKAGAMFLADYISRYDGNFARWYSTNTTAQASYRQNVFSVVPRFARGLA